jgi:multiple sugar transport system permease protein
VILAALQTVPGSLYEAARVDGATPWGRFRYVTIPAIVPTLSLLAILSSIFAIQQFTLIYLTTGGGPVTATNTLAIDIYQQAFRFYDFSYASTVAAAGLLTSALAVILFIFIEKRAGVGELA